MKSVLTRDHGPKAITRTGRAAPRMIPHAAMPTSQRRSVKFEFPSYEGHGMHNSGKLLSLQRIALVGTSVPRQCGIATFTEDLFQSIRGTDQALDLSVIAINDRPEGYAYPGHVSFEIVQDDPASYRVAADFLDVSDPQIVCLQHEFGIFGGHAGEYIQGLLDGLKMPLVTTLHTVLDQPDIQHRRVMRLLAQHSAKLVVMAEKGRRILQEVYDVPARQIAVIPHGVPDRAFQDPALAKHRLDLADRTMLMTFGLLGPGKGIETAICALPALLREHPRVLYMIVGATHPNLLRSEGERYRQTLLELAQTLGVSEHVRFVNQYFSNAELLEYLAACDIYVSPYPNVAQITSGTLAYALALGKPVVSTPFWHAQELLADDCGVIAPFGEPDAFAEAIANLIDDDKLRSRIRTNAYERGRAMSWPQVGQQYLSLFEQIRTQVRSIGAEIISFPPPAAAPLPDVSTAHLAQLTDDVGLIQHTKFGVAHRRHGYCLDDNARALVVMAEVAADREWTLQEERMCQTYAAFVEDAMSPPSGQVGNFMRFDRTWYDDGAVDDAFGRTIWALGKVAALSDGRGLSSWAAARLLDSAPLLPSFAAPRCWAYGLLGISAFLTRFPGHRQFEALRDELAARLQQRLRDAAGSDWLWFEDRLAYDNARLCEALIICGRDTGNASMLAAGLDTLRWLMDLQRASAGHFRPVGTQSFGNDHALPSAFDQQPLEVWAAVSACLTAHRATKDALWLEDARRAFNWFLGENDLSLPVVDTMRGACYDGLHPDRRNANQGAESTLAYLGALTALVSFEALQEFSGERADEARCNRSEVRPGLLRRAAGS
jgi:glycosyltransferase involved in cell wall biosynthesis